MSLVAYANSDDESGSENGDEIGEEPKNDQLITEKLGGASNSKHQTDNASRDDQERVDDDVPISDEEDDFITSVDAPPTGLTLPAPQHNTVTAATTNKAQNVSTTSSFLSELPKPKTDQNETVNEQEDEIEDFVKQRTEKLKADVNLEKKPSSQKRARVKISVPQLNDADSDDDEKWTKKKRPLLAAGSSKKSGLFSVLPAPKNRSLGGGKSDSSGERIFTDYFKKPNKSSDTGQSIANPTETSDSPSLPKIKASAPFVPASLNRKHRQSGKSAFNFETGIMMSTQARKSAKAANAKSEEVSNSKSMDNDGPNVDSSGDPIETDNAEDEENHAGEGSNFFSLTVAGESKNNPLSANSLSVTASTSTLPGVGANKDSTQDAGNASAYKPIVPSLQDQPLNFQARNSNPQNAPLHFKGASSGSGPGYNYNATAASYNSDFYNMANYEEGDEESGTTNLQEGASSAQGSFDEQEFIKMQGKSNRRKEVVNFIDVCQDDQTSGVDMNMVKSLSEENTNRQSSSKKNKDLPSSQQKRKHQITYLAFKAKEREVELKDAWAANRQTKRQTQSKYGF